MRVLATVLAGIMVSGAGLAGAFPALAASGGEQKLKKIGTIQKADQELKFSRDMLTISENGRTWVCSPLGKKASAGSYDGPGMALTDEIWEVSRADDKNVSWKGLIKKDGTVLIDADAAVLRKLSNRYLAVTRTDKVTTDRSKAMVFQTARNFSLGNPTDEEVMYTGYIAIYDMERERLVPSVRLTSNKETVYGYGNILTVQEPGKPDRYYTADGEEISTEGHTLNQCNSFLVEAEKGSGTGKSYVVYDENMHKLFQTAEMPKELRSASGLCPAGDRMGYMGYKRNGKTGVLDAAGKAVISAEYDDIQWIGENAFLVKKGNSYGLLKENGDVLAECVYDTIAYVQDGYYLAYKNSASGKAGTIIGPDGIVLKDTKETIHPYTLLSSKKDGTGVLNYVVKDKDYRLRTDSPGKELGFFLLGVKGADKKYGVFDMISGKQLLEDEYDDVEYANGHLYALRAGVYTVYEVGR